MTEEEILQQYSTPGLRKHELTRHEHEERLKAHVSKPSKEEIIEILDLVHGTEEPS